MINIEKDASFNKNLSFTIDNQDNDEFRWWKQVELQKLILASNRIKLITSDIKNLQNLTTLDVKSLE